jgi:hypothetical protein
LQQKEEGKEVVEDIAGKKGRVEREGRGREFEGRCLASRDRRGFNFFPGNYPDDVL